MILHRSLAFVSAFVLGLHALTPLPHCDADNCYRALFPCPTPSAVASASAFCATITADGTTATNFPSRATAACGTVPGRYISACVCGPTCPIIPSVTPTPTPCASYGGLLTNGDFECGISPWTVNRPDPFAVAGITSDSANTGLKSFEARLFSNRTLQNPTVSARVKSAIILVQQGVPLKLSFSVWFDNMDAGFVGVMLNGEPVRTIDARDGPGWGIWKTSFVEYTPNSDSVQITFEFLFGTVASVARLDSVVFDYLH
ncbi:uncharacterized protein CTRU02_210894 [Colletotrichum truncatum]|uniref:Uncharacterized protein n=1 Tax=Colletotrichum truncatum TaxID=5467 RepID=A0ACC3YQC2_COLTU|nr:uncharacterized protein CTRU02_03620 [Colletotrichum truncatum]KAF6796642.1 hypothetical protein CTRU02_03620 [Colletotrichum truncatum]